MNMRTRFMQLVAIIAMTGVSLAVSATTPKPLLVWCQNCTGLQMVQQAKQQPPGSTVYVADAINDAIVTYYIDASTAPPSPYMPMPSIPQSVTPDPVLLAGLEDAIAFYNAAPVGWHKYFSIAVNHTTYPSDDYPGSIYDVINGGSPRNRFDSDANELFGTGTDDHTMLFLLGHAIQTLANVHAVNMATGPAVYTTITFEDGSSVHLVYDSATGSLKMDPNTAQDSHGNSIPYLGKDGKIHNLGGIHDFSNGHGGNPNDLNSFLDQLQALQATQHGWACSSTGSGDNTVYTCSLY